MTGLMLVMLAAFGLLFARLYHLQLLSGAEYYRLSENNCIRLQTLNPSRGLILDSRGVILADNRPSYDVYLVPRDARPLDRVLSELCDIMGIPPERRGEVGKKVRANPPYKAALVREDVDRDVLAVIESHRFELPGVQVRVKPLRHYPRDRSASHVVGYLSEISRRELSSGGYPHRRPGDYIGKYGIEKTYEDELAGRHGGRQVEVDAKGRIVSVLRTVPSVPGNNVVLTLDSRMQARAEELLGEEVGAVVAVEANTGRILAMASKPAFDPNLFVGGMSSAQWRELIADPDRPLRNKAVTARYPPGSTYKIITALAGLEEGVVNADTEHFCPGHYRFANRTYRCWRRAGHGNISLVQAIAQSCDVYFYKVGEALGVDRLAFYARAAGLGSRTGVDLGDENPGLIPDSDWKLRARNEPWQGGETLSVAIGQGFNLTTPLQMAMVAASVGNGGTLYKPLIVDRVLAPDGETVIENRPEPVGRLPVSPRNLELVREGLWEVVNGDRGTARVARLKNVDMAGKTGTAQVVGRGGREQFLNETSDERRFQDHAWFVSYAPADEGRIACAVMVEHGKHGSSAASPIARDLTDLYINGGIVAETPSEKPLG